MKACTYCGKEYPDEATTCSIDQQPLGSFSPVYSRIESTTRVELFSPLTPAECASKLAAAIDRESCMPFLLGAMFGSKLVISRVTASSIRLCKRIFYRNSFPSVFSATFIAVGSGTVISGEFKMPPLVRAFMFSGLAGSFLAVARWSFFQSSGQSGVQPNKKGHGSEWSVLLSCLRLDLPLCVLDDFWRATNPDSSWSF